MASLAYEQSRHAIPKRETGAIRFVHAHTLSVIEYGHLVNNMLSIAYSSTTFRVDRASIARYSHQFTAM